MSETYSPRTVAFVALASLVVGFLVVFGGGMLLLRPRARDTSAADEGSAASAHRDDGGAPAVPATTRGDAATAEAHDGGAAAEPVSAAGITISPANTSRCYDQGPPVPIAGAQCDHLTALDQHLASKAAEIATCARSGAHGRLSLYLDFRFSTSFWRGWGLPTSNIPNAGDVAACVKQRIAPLPFATMPHEHDRYLVVVHIDW